MNEHRKIMRAIWACFACSDRKTLQCDKDFEASMDAGKAFYELISSGSNIIMISLAQKLLKTERYKTKMILVKRHMALNS